LQEGFPPSELLTMPLKTPLSPVRDPSFSALLDALASIPDPRDPRGVRYPLHGLLALCVLAFMCGAQNLSQIRRFGLRHKALLPALGFKRKKVPAVSGFSRILGLVPVARLQGALGRWLAQALAQRAGPLPVAASVDGKASKASGCHVLNVFLHDLEQVLWQSPVESKQNEITAFKAALAGLLDTYPFLRIFVGDAMFTGAPLCSDLIENGKHYLFQVKADQPQLLEKMELLFAPRCHRAPSSEAFEGEKKEGLRRDARELEA
jgi:hypothetical protein